MYINGIASGATQYTTTDSFDQAHPVGITLGSEEATLDIYSIRIYDIALNGQQVVNNWIANTSDPVLKAERYYRNDNFDDTGHISLNKLPSTTPYIIWDLPELPTAKGDKKSGNAEYTDPTDSSRNFTAIGAQYDVQGTSSAKYPVKNIRFRPEKGAEWFDDEGNDLKAKGVGFPITYPGGIGVGYFTFKVDYASSEGANNVELVRLYNDVSKKYGILTPPQYADMKATGETDTAIRVGIDGFPVVAFHRDASGKETFCTKANFNNDKNNPDVFGFAAGDESWEITNNTSGLSRFKVSVNEENFKTDDGQDFEIRYPNIDDYSDITLLKPMTEWVVSTNTETATNEPFSSPKTLVYTNVVQAEDLSFNTKTVTETFEADTAEYRLAKFKAELADHFNVNSTLFYYLFTEMFLMVDSRAKNAFPTYFKSRVAGDGGNRWFWLPYDMDTAIGINNEGELAFSYDKEDIDTINGDPDGPEVYNGQDSVMWKNVRAAYMGELTKMYQELRSQGLFSFENIEKMFEDHQGKWSENIFNEDAKLKYVAPLINTGNDYLGMLQGAKAEQRRWWLYNRFRYLDSKYNAASAVDEQNTIQFRAFVQDTSNTPDITIIPYADIYAAVSYKNNNLAQIRAHRGQEAILPSPKGEGAKMSDQEVYIYSASQLASIGDLSRFYPGYAQIGYATRLQSLKIGDASFNNPNFKRLTATNNPLLKTIDARRCVAWGIMDTSSTIDNQQRAVDLRACTGLEELYLDGTALIGVDLADGSNIRICHFPSTLTSLRLKNQLFLEELQFNKLEGDSLVSEDLDVVFSNLTEVWLENLKPQLLNVRRLVADMPNEAKLCLIGINETFDTYTSLVTFYNNLDRLSGLDANGNRTDIKRTISGTINLTEAISYARYIELKSRYPSLDINARVICTVRFYNNEELIEGPDAVQTVRMGDSVRDPGPQEKPATFAKTFVFTGWDASLDNIQEDLNINAVYRADDKSYTVTYDVRSAVATLETYSYTKTYDEWAETPVPNPTPAETDERVTFDGWYLADGTPWIFSTDRVSAFHRDITLYAHWSDPDKPEISSFERENCFKVRAEASDEFGIIAYGFSTAADVEPEDWISISPAVVNFDQLFDVKGISGQQYFWIKDTMNTVVSSNPVTTRLFTRQIAPGATLILKENNVVVESDSEAVIGTPHLDIIVELDPHYENLQVSFNGEPIGSTASIDIDTDSSLVITCDPMNYEVTFDAGINGEEVDTQIIEYNNLIKTPFKNQFQYTENATDGFIIDSWCLEDGTPWDFATDKVTENMTLYAH